MTQKCRLRLGKHSLAWHFFVTLPSRVFQLSCCVSSLLPTRLALVLTDQTMVMIWIRELVVQQHLLLLMKKRSFWIKNKRAKLKSRGQKICIFLSLCTRNNANSLPCHSFESGPLDLLELTLVRSEKQSILFYQQETRKNQRNNHDVIISII